MGRIEIDGDSHKTRANDWAISATSEERKSAS